MRRLAMAAAAACLAASAAGAAPSEVPAGPREAPRTWDLPLGEALAIPGLVAQPAGGEELILAKKSSKARKPGKRAGAPVRRPSGNRHGSGVNYKSGNNIVVNRGHPNYRRYGGGGRVYYEDDDNDGLAGALVGGVIGLGVGAAIASSSTPDSTCVDNNGDGVCDAY